MNFMHNILPADDESHFLPQWVRLGLCSQNAHFEEQLQPQIKKHHSKSLKLKL